MKSYKIVVTGAFNAGKTLFIQTVSDIELVTTERRITDPGIAGVKDETTVAMDYGNKRIGDTLLHLYGTPGQTRFEFMWGILAREMDAFILLVDSTDRGSLMEAVQIIRFFNKQTKNPFIVAANKQDGVSALPPEEIARLLKLPETVPVLPCVASDKSAVERVLAKGLELVH